LLPARNRRDLDEIPASVRDVVEFRFVERVDELIALALAPAAVAAPAPEVVALA
jgi:ATP-dependent Lon protease